MTKLDELLELQRLKRATSREGAYLNTSQLEEDFLEFSRYAPSQALQVILPKLYAPEGDEEQHLAAVAAKLGWSRMPAALDVSGGYNCAGPQNDVVLVSSRQLQADTFHARAHLLPLVERIYSEGAGLVRDFALHEALSGKVSCRRGDLELREVQLFPERFSRGPYQLSVTLETPRGTVAAFQELERELQEIAKSPKELLRQPGRVRLASGKAVELRKLLGSLSRYESPPVQQFSVTVNSCVVRTGKAELFYLYSPQKRENCMLYFGANPFPVGSEPKELLVIPGEEHNHAIPKLLELQVLDPSPAVLQRRIKELENWYQHAARREGSQLSAHAGHQKLVQDLRQSMLYFSSVLNADMRREYVMKQHAELLEFMVCPATQDPVIHELLPRLSWNSAVRRYHHTTAFIAEFEAADNDARKHMLQLVTSNLFFSNQQNYDVNAWLYQNHRQFCINSRIEFEAKKGSDAERPGVKEPGVRR